VDRVEEAETSFANACGLAAVVGQSRSHLRRGNSAAPLELLEPLSEALDHPLVFRLLGRALRDPGRLDNARLALG